MNKQEGSKTRYYVQWDTHARHMCTILCSLMEHQSLVDLAICCGTNTIHAHKCVLAANSPYFREQLEKNSGTEQIIISGLDFAIVKSIIEFMYCGETNILDENLKYMIAAAKFFQMRGLQTLVSDHQDIRFEADAIHIAPPIFMPKKPKYPSAYRPVNNVALPPLGAFKNPLPDDPYFHRRLKRKYVRTEAEKACAKEAAASRFALEALQKELATTSQMSSFVIEESCTETTVENFIPHSEESYMSGLNHMDTVPLQVVNYDELNNSLITTGQVISLNKADNGGNVLQYEVDSNDTKDKIKQIIGAEIPGNVEIMYRTSEGNFVTVTEDVFQNLSGGTLQYQIVDENGHVGEIRELQVQHQNAPTVYESSKNMPDLDLGLNVEHTEESLDSFHSVNNCDKNISLDKTVDLCNDEEMQPCEAVNEISSNQSPVTAGGLCPKNDDEDPFIVALNSREGIISHSDLKQRDHFINLHGINNENCTIEENVEHCRSIDTNFASGNRAGDFNLIGDNYLNIESDSPEHDTDDGGGDCKIPIRRLKAALLSKMHSAPVGEEHVPLQIFEDVHGIECSTFRRTRSGLKPLDISDNSLLGFDDEKDLAFEQFTHCSNKQRRLIPPRKKK